jgi:hypothetical protein
VKDVENRGEVDDVPCKYGSLIDTTSSKHQHAETRPTHVLFINASYKSRLFLGTYIHVLPPETLRTFMRAYSA